MLGWDDTPEACGGRDRAGGRRLRRWKDDHGTARGRPSGLGWLHHQSEKLSRQESINFHPKRLPWRPHLQLGCDGWHSHWLGLRNQL